ncbi:uncharacterized protein KY384_007743 [Bacidia gigantensis]|uniref:uncharacterized protein n=1 Tax=Bacidia gigantensis TaxID=2732470 RepID=UPI001D048AA9|nr:uncharacterized protein KY384_007743 [Bacidia gigantensis]KAG8527590.1 hypothetical protein KY384_007743 [Bacidia gigantensis]
MSFISPHTGGHPTKAPGFGNAPDPFASISQNRGIEDEEDAIDFEDTYDGLGDQLDDADDDLNDDTFGGGNSGSKAPARDFDFFGNTNKVSDAINEEAIRYQRQSKYSARPLVSVEPSKPTPKSYKTGYEAYKKPGYVPDLQVDPSLWGTASISAVPSNTGPNLSQQERPSVPPQKKMMSLEEVEAAMRAQPKKPSLSFRSQQPARSPPKQAQATFPAQQASRGVELSSSQRSQGPPVQILQHSQQSHAQSRDHLPPQSRANRSLEQIHATNLPEQPSQVQATQILQRPQPRMPLPQSTDVSNQPRQILQNPNRNSLPPDQRNMEPPEPILHLGDLTAAQSGTQVALPIITHPAQLATLSPEQREAYATEEARRAKRNHKIFLMSKGNGLMTPQDKNFITRIQLQQLMTATGNVNDSNPDVSLAEDFYYQVYNQIENRPRQHPHQPLSNFAQTYLFQTGGRQGVLNRRNNRGDNHMHRMQQQVQRAIEAAKAKPKNKQLVIEGSLGKISFSNSKTPRPMLNIKRNDNLPQVSLNATDRKSILKNIEAVYASLMEIEDNDRRAPPQPLNGEDATTSDHYHLWQQTYEELNEKLWSELRVKEPIMQNSQAMHPFIAFLSYPKGKRAIPRIFSHMNDQQRLTIVTIIMIQLDTLDVVRSAQPQVAATQSRSVVSEQVDLFLQAVMPSLLSYVNEAPLDVIIGLLGLVLGRVNATAVSKSRVGLEILTMLLSQAEIIRKAEATNDLEWSQWLATYNQLFDTVEPLLSIIFPESVSAGGDVYVWQFLATVGTGASPEQQQRLVLAVKDRVMDTVQQCKTLPPEMAAQRKGDVNLFMQAIGLDVDLLEG